jgi:hypothetical protein
MPHAAAAYAIQAPPSVISKANPRPTFENPSVYLENARRFERLQNQVAETKLLPDDWDLYDSDRPNDDARATTLRVLRELELESLLPQGIQPMAEGGIAVSFFARPRRATIEVHNDGGIVFVTYSDNREEVEAWEARLGGKDFVSQLLKLRQHLVNA